MGSPLRQERERRGWTLEQVADAVRQLGHERGHHNLGIDANAVSRHERGVIGLPRHPYPSLYSELYGVPLAALWPAARIDGMDRRTFLQVIAAASGGTLLGGDDDLQAMLAVTAGLRRLEPTTPAADLRGSVGTHLRLVGQRADRGPAYAAAAAEVARFAAWLAWDQDEQAQSRALYGRAVRYGERSGDAVVGAYMLGSWALWAAETGHGGEAVRLGRRVADVRPLGPWLHAMHATVASSVRDADGTLAGLRDAERAMTAEQQPAWPFIYPFTPAKLQGYAGRCYVRLGLHKAAVPALREALDGTGRTKQRAVLLGDLARALGDGDEARELHTEARRIGAELASRKVLSRA
jgi:transcriptional regulator with XRE-family HTH domain